MNTVTNTEVASAVLTQGLGKTAFDMKLKVEAAGLYRVVFVEGASPICSDLVAAV